MGHGPRFPQWRTLGSGTRPAPRTVEVPHDFAAALDAEPAARVMFDSLSYSNQSWHVLQVTGAKTDETRQRRITKSVQTLRAGRKR
ncbi:MAG TPA: YdeI/OmpD-associated family protein [Acidimicrobiia bacterium]|nr:YdeI/OmpD-associated family protein [Acidimicrobiia bacterium]